MKKKKAQERMMELQPGAFREIPTTQINQRFAPIPETTEELPDIYEILQRIEDKIDALNKKVSKLTKQ